MNTQTTLEQLKQLKLIGMADAYQAVLSLPVQDQPSIHQFLARLSEAELQHRAHLKTQAYLKLSKLRYNAVFEQVYCNATRNLTQDQLIKIADCGFIERSENVLITGATGCGKSYLACAIGRQACSFGYKTLYLGMSRFLEKVTQTKLDGTYLKLLNQIEKTQLLIFDDFGLHPLDKITRLTLLQILEDRYGKRSTLISSQLPVNRWHEYIGENTIADAIMDRLAGNAHRFDLKGDSLRKKKQEKFA
ncbi:MAG TPA: IS21-like element helper ATPase IstB [Bacteroidales bacterium]|nr:IS21-like element helper ATPase IstB [Bacteroidales bacterium]